MVIKRQSPWKAARKIYERRTKQKDAEVQKWDLAWIKRSPTMYGRVLFEECKIPIAQSKRPAELLSSVMITLKKEGVDQKAMEKIIDGIIKQAKGHGMDLEKELKNPEKKKK